MSFLSKLNPFATNPRRQIVCPLCGSHETYKTNSFIAYADLKSTLNVRGSTWTQAHGSEVIDPPAGVALTQIVNERFPGIDEGADDDHRRCRQCRSLLPLQFWREGPAEQFGITVTGAPRHGKTTWLLSMMSAADSDLYDVIGSGGNTTVLPYPYAEPYTIDLMKTDFRSAIPYVLLGGTVALAADRTINVRTLDIRGESFFHNPQATHPVIANHLGAREAMGAFLIVDKFEKTKQPQNSLAPVFSGILTYFQTEELDTSDIWMGVIWTFLDQASWNHETATWLTAQLGPLADPLMLIAASTPDFYGDPDVFAALEMLVGERNQQHLRKLLERVDVARVLLPEVIEGLVALLFRCQLTYSLHGARTAGKYAYYRNRGREFVSGCQRLARSLYLRWDAATGAIGGMVGSRNLRVLPCGRWPMSLSQASTQPQQMYPVWRDQILIQAFESVRAR